MGHSHEYRSHYKIMGGQKIPYEILTKSSFNEEEQPGDISTSGRGSA